MWPVELAYKSGHRVRHNSERVKKFSTPSAIAVTISVVPLPSFPFQTQFSSHFAHRKPLDIFARKIPWDTLSFSLCTSMLRRTPRSKLLESGPPCPLRAQVST